MHRYLKAILLTVLTFFSFSIHTYAGYTSDKMKPDPQKFYEAAANGDAVTLHKMINGGIDVNLQDSNGITPLMIAAAYGKLEAVQVLLNSGANPYAEDNDGNTVLDIAQHYRYEEEMALQGNHPAVIETIVRNMMPINLYFPDNFANFGDVYITGFEGRSKGLGWGFTYETDNLYTTVYVYDYGVKNIPDGIQSSAVKNHLDAAVNDLYQLEEQSYIYGIIEVERTVIQAGKRKYLIATYNFFNKQDALMTAHFVLCGYKGHFIKMRFSYNTGSSYESRREMQTFLEEVSKMLE